MNELLTTDPTILVIRGFIFAHPYLQFMGVFSLFLVAIFQIELKSMWFRIVLILFLVSLVDPTYLWAVNALLPKLGLNQLPYFELRFWAASWTRPSRSVSGTEASSSKVWPKCGAKSRERAGEVHAGRPSGACAGCWSVSRAPQFRSERPGGQPEMVPTVRITPAAVR